MKNDQRLEQHTRYTLAWNDLLFAGSIANLILKEGLTDTGRVERLTEKRALATALVITYARPFTSAKGFVKLPSGVFEGVCNDQRVIHRALLSLRNQVYAHTDVQYFSVRREKLNGQITAIPSLPRAILFGLPAQLVSETAELIEALKAEVTKRQKEIEELLTGDAPRSSL